MISIQLSLKDKYKNDIIKKCKDKLNIKNHMSIPKITCIYLSMGLGDAANDFKIIEKNKHCLELICGQKVVITTAKKAISSFKLRKGMPIGLKVTLRRHRMWDFLDKFVNIALPRVRDFRGLKKKFDKNGNLTIGIKENIIFPEIDYMDVDKVRGLNITIVTSSSNDNEAYFLLKELGLPFSK
jgi:large subunit ribosomal protein L5